MKAYEFANKTLKLTERAVPDPSDNEVLIRVKAAGVNRPDIFQRLGAYPPPKGVTDIPGLEVSGIVELPDMAGNFKKGDAVVALVAGGGYAEYVTAPIQQVLPLPRGLNFIQGAGLPETFFTVWTNLFDSGHLEEGEKLLIHGGSSGIGTTAIQMAKFYDCTVFITAGTDEKCAFCRDIGADFVINYKDRDFVEVIQDKSPVGVHVILDMVGGDYYARNIACLAPFGRLVSIAMLQGKKGEVDIPTIMRKRLTLTGSTLRARSPIEKGKIAQALKQNIWPALESGEIKPVIDTVFDFYDEAELAHQKMMERGPIGKYILSLV